MARIEFETGEDALYCETSDVARWFEQYDDFDAETTPTAEQVKEHILEWMEYIDRQTGHAWRSNTVAEEMKDPDGTYHWWSGRALNLSKRDVHPLDSAEGDKLEEWNGSGWNDWVADPGKTEGRNGDYWLDRTTGILYVKDRFTFNQHPQFRVTYRYGNPNGATKAIQMACAKLVAQDLVSTDQYSMNIPGTDGSMEPAAMAEQWRQDAEEVIAEREETEYVEPY